MSEVSEKGLPLAETIEAAIAVYENKTRGQSLITRDSPDQEVLSPIAAAIERLPEYQAVLGNNLFRLGMVSPINSDSLAQFVFSRAQWKSASDAVGWLAGLLNTRTTNVVLGAAIWGIAIDQEIMLSDSSRLLLFEHMPSSYGKSLIADRKKWQPSPFIWYSERHFDLPQVAYTKEIQNVPLISSDYLGSAQLNEAAESAMELCRLVEAVGIGRPLPMAYWFEFQDVELGGISNAYFLSWNLPEVHPRVESIVRLDAGDVSELYSAFRSLAFDWKSDLRRSMDRYTLSQCRHALIDKVLDLALAFEIAVSQKGDNLPVRWKVSVRAAQLIGGDMEKRLSNRRLVGQLYDLRNRATHGSRLADIDRELLSNCAMIYRLLLRRLLTFSDRPDWNSIELESPSHP
jgi:hypothetical protein